MSTEHITQPIIEVKNLSKKYIIAHHRGRYIALRDILTNIIRHPLLFVGKKAREFAGMDTKETFWALKDVNLKIYRGEAIGIIGANGAGKSTLLKILTGITPPTEGEAILRGRVASLLEVGTGFHPELTGRDNIFLNGAILGMRKKEIVEKFDEIVAFAGIDKFLDTPVKHYSSGMYVRLAFSVAAHMDPDILLVDEVLAVGDAEFQKKCLGKMDEVTKQAGRTIFLVSHNMGAIQRLCTRTILLEQGQVKMVGPTQEVVEHYLAYTNNLSNIPIRDRVDRKGTQELKVSDCYLENTDGNKTNQVLSGEDTTLVFEYVFSGKKPLGNIVIGANVLNSEGNSLFLLHNGMTKADFGEIQDDGKFKCKLTHLPLTPGVYYATVRITADDVELDYISNILKIEVLPGDFYGTGSSIAHSQFYVEHLWSLEPGNNEHA